MMYLKNATRVVLLMACFLAGAFFSLQAQPTKPSTCVNLDFSKGDFSGWVGRTTVYRPNAPDASNCDQNTMTLVNCPSGMGVSCNGCYSGCLQPGACPTPGNPQGTPVPGSNPFTLNPPMMVSGQLYDNIGIVPGRHTIMAAPSVPDPYACNNIMTLPAGDNFCARLGNGGYNQAGTNPNNPNNPQGHTGVGYEIDYLSYTFRVDQTNTLLTYKYAVVLQDPLRDPTVPEHSPAIRPRFNVYVRDSTKGTLIDPICGKFEVVYDTLISGFRTCGITDITNLGGNPFAKVGTAYRAWTTVGVDLRKQIGNLVTITFNTWDCGWGAHFGYAYISARCDSFAIQQSGCNPDGSVTLTAPLGFTYSWSTGQTTRSISVVGSNPGDTVKVILTTVNGCTTDLYTVIYPTSIKANMKAAPLVACIKDNKFTFTDSSYSIYSGSGQNVPIVSWEWNFGDGDTSFARFPTHSYKAPGTYTVRLKVTNFQGCIDTTSQVVVVLPPPLANFTMGDVCLGENVNFQDLSTTPAGTINSWSWSFGDGTTAVGQNQQHKYTAPGTYTVSLKITATTGCLHDTSFAVKVWPKPFARFTADTVCLGDSTSFINLSFPGDPADPIIDRIWVFGDTTPLSGALNPKHVYGYPRSYTVKLIVSTQRGCLDDTTINVMVYPFAKADFTADPLCLGTPVNFKDLSTPAAIINSWRWNFGDGNTSAVQNPTNLYALPGIYNIKLVTTTPNGCNDSVVKPLVIPPLPDPDFDANRYEGCVPLCVNFYDLTYSPTDTIVDWKWTFGDGNSGVGKLPPHCYQDTGRFTVSFTITTANGCKLEKTWVNMIWVHPWPIADFTATPPSTTESAPSVVISDKAWGAITWLYDLGDGTSSTNRNPVHDYPKAGKYTIWQYVTNQWGCRDSIARVIIVTPEWSFYIPNAFSPNGDGKNEGFKGKSWNVIEHQMWIFDRWGNMIYTTGQTKNPEEAVPWDGRANGGKDEAQEDVYVWLVEIKDIFGKHHKLIGHVTLVK